MTDITPPPDLVQQWFDDARNAWAEPQHYVATRAAQYGADQELEACCEWVSKYLPYLGAFPMPEDALRVARRPKPPSLKEQALAELEEWENVMDIAPDSPIRRALEALPDA